MGIMDKFKSGFGKVKSKFVQEEESNDFNSQPVSAPVRQTTQPSADDFFQPKQTPPQPMVMPEPTPPPQPIEQQERFVPSFMFEIRGVFVVTGRGVVVAGTIEKGAIQDGDKVMIIKRNHTRINAQVIGIEMFRKVVNNAVEGDSVGLLLGGVTRADCSEGDYIVK